ncbi:MAG: dipeptidase, partial [Rubrimonas sp.]
MTPTPVFDGHNDLLFQLWRARDREGLAFFEGRPRGHVDLPRMRAGGMTGGLFAIWTPNGLNPAEDEDDLVLFPPVEADRARRATLAMAGMLIRMAAARPDAVRLCRSAAEIEAANAAGAVAAVMHVEGCEGFGPDLDELHVLHAAGVRSLGPVWSRDNIFGCGVPFRFPAGPDTGPGLTGAGERLVRACDALGVMVDLSHLNEAGFWDVARISDRPLLASHSNAHALCPSTRNLTDRQLDAIAERGGLVGLNFAVRFLRQDGRADRDTDLSVMVRHLAHLVERLGEGGVAFGSDFDGA